MSHHPSANDSGLNLDHLEALARAANPGPWEWWTSNSILRLSAADGIDGGVLQAYSRRGVSDICCSTSDRAFIAAANPAAVLELISLARAALAHQSAKDQEESATNIESRPEDDQHWAQVSPAVAFHLIERHAEDWNDAGRMMLQWHNAISWAAQQEPVAAPCVICGSDEPRTGTCGSDDPRALCTQPVAAPRQAESGLPLDVEFKQLADTILQATTNGARLEALRSMAVLFDKQAAQLDGGQGGSAT
jgi:hypothetical protein